jgi:chemotaxis protein MotA
VGGWSLLNRKQHLLPYDQGMLVGLGAIIVFLSVLGGYAAMGARLHVLWQPFEFLIVIGAAVGGFVTANPKDVLARTWASIHSALAGPRYSLEDFQNLLCFQYATFRMIRNKGPMSVESHIDRPAESSLFKSFPGILNDTEALPFVCDALRLVSMGVDDPHQLDMATETELETLYEENIRVAHALQNTADGLPALGIVAAVLGVIKTMGSISESPEVLGHLIGAAFVGTFLGIFLSYGFVAPLANMIKSVLDIERQYLACLRSGLVAFLHGSPPAVAVEFARKSLFVSVRPSFATMENAMSRIPALK